MQHTQASSLPSGFSLKTDATEYVFGLRPCLEDRETEARQERGHVPQGSPFFGQHVGGVKIMSTLAVGPFYAVRRACGESQQTLPPGGLMIGAKRSCQAPSADSMMTPRLPESHNSGSE